MAIVYGANYGRPTLDLNFAKNKSLIDTISGRNLVTFTRSQTAREATYVGADGLIKTAAANEPRFDHNPTTGESLGLLVEEARTNLIKSSNNFIFNDWHFTQCQMTPNAVAAPDGTQTAALIQQTNGTSTRQFICTSYSVPSTGSSWTASVFVKKFNYDYVIFGAGDEDSGSRGSRFGYLQAQLLFQFSTKTLTVNPSTNWGGVVTGSGYEELSNGWFRLWVSKASFPRANYWGISVQQTLTGSLETGGDLNLVTGDGSSGVYFWGMQWESGGFKTSHIPTPTSATVTRAADVASITGTNFSSWYNNSEGTFLATIPAVSLTYNLRYLIDCGSSATSGAGASGHVLFGNLNNTNVAGGVTDVSNDSVAGPSAAYTGNIVRVSYAYKVNNFNAAVNGTLGTLDTSGAIPTLGAQQLVIGSRFNGTFYINRTIARLTYYPVRLPDATLQTLTK
jgi:hypothetical protein